MPFIMYAMIDYYVKITRDSWKSMNFKFGGEWYFIKKRKEWEW